MQLRYLAAYWKDNRLLAEVGERSQREIFSEDVGKFTIYDFSALKGRDLYRKFLIQNLKSQIPSSARLVKSQKSIENYEGNFETFVIFALSLPNQVNKQT